MLVLILMLEVFLFTPVFGLRPPLTSDERGFKEETDALEDEVAGRDPAFGGCGKAAILMVFLTVFSGIGSVLLADDADLSVGTTGDEADVSGVGSAEGRGEAVGILSFIGVCVGVFATGRLFRGFDEGIAGSGVVGASNEGVVDIVAAMSFQWESACA